MSNKATPLTGKGREYQPTPRVVQMTPQLAEKILENNRLNRPLRSGRVERYAKDMKEGRWEQNGETIKMTDGGDLLDGQHRLFAVIEAEVSVPMLIIEGLDAKVMPTIDTGASRSYGDVLSIRGNKNTLVTASILRWLYWYFANPRPTNPMSASISHGQLDEFAEFHKDVPERASEIASSKAKRFAPASILGFAYTLAYRVDAGKAGAWLSLLDTGAGLEERHPVYLLRERLVANRMAKAKLQPVDVAALMIKSWNNFYTGARPKVLRWSVEEQFPDVTGLIPVEQVRRRRRPRSVE